MDINVTLITALGIFCLTLIALVTVAQNPSQNKLVGEAIKSLEGVMQSVLGKKGKK